MGTKAIVVISDIHMAADDRMGIFHGGAELEAFIEHQAKRPGELELVILGDALDYLQILPDLSFTSQHAGDKTKLIIDHNPGVFKALGALLDAPGKTLVWCIGNHDIELLFESARAAIEEALFGAGAPPARKTRLTWHLNGSSRVYPLADGTQIRLNHGNQPDKWNRIDYAKARTIAESGGDPEFVYPHGSLLVAKVLNPLKEDGYGHVDLLKPEESVAIPLSLALWPSRTKELLRDAFQVSRQVFWESVVEAVAKPFRTQEQYFGKNDPQGLERTLPPGLAELIADGLREAAQEAGDGRRAGDLKALLEVEDNDAEEPVKIGAEPTATFELRPASRALSYLFRGSAAVAARLDRSFELDTTEKAGIGEQAKRAFKEQKVAVMVVGHTHMARAVTMEDGYYLNTGTWADLMRLPQSLPDASFHASAKSLRAHLKNPELAPWHLRPFRRPTYVEINIGPQANGKSYSAALKQWCPAPTMELFQFP